MFWREGTEQEGYKRAAVKIFDSRVFRKMTVDTGIIRITEKPALLTNDPAILQELSGMTQYQTGSRLQIITAKENLKKKGEAGFVMNPCFSPDGAEKPFPEITLAQKNPFPPI